MKTSKLLTYVCLFLFLFTDFAFVAPAYGDWKTQQLLRQQRQQQMQQQEAQRRQQEAQRRQQQLAAQRRQQQEAQRRQQQEMRRRMQERQRIAQAQRQQKMKQQQQARQQQKMIKMKGQQKLIKQQNAKRQGQLAANRDTKLKQLLSKRKAQQQIKRKKDAQKSNRNMTMTALLANQRAISMTNRASPTKQAHTKQLDNKKRSLLEYSQKLKLASLNLAKDKALKSPKAKIRKNTESLKNKLKKFQKCPGGVCGLNKGNCSFHGDTLVLTDNGYRTIRSLEPYRDFVWARDERTGVTDWKPVTAHYSNPYPETVHITIRDIKNSAQQTLISNRIHPFYVGVSLATIPNHMPIGTNATGTWIEAQHLNTGQRLLNADNSWSEVVSVTILTQPLLAFNLTVADFHTYFVKDADSDYADPVWVHNKCFDLKDIPSLAGGDYNKLLKSADSQLLKLGWTKAPLRSGSGIRYYDGKGNTVRFNKGYLKADDPMHAGPYLYIVYNGKKQRIALKGNPILK